MENPDIDDIISISSGIHCIRIFALAVDNLAAGTLLTYLVEEQAAHVTDQKVIAANDFLVGQLGMSTAELQSAKDVLRDKNIVMIDTHNPHGRTGYTLDTAVLIKILQPFLIDKLNKFLKATTTKKPPKQQPRVFDNSTVEYQISQALLILIQRRQPTYFSKTLDTPVAKDKKLRMWAEEIDKMIRIDGRNPVEILAIVEWSQQDDFWQRNIKSTQKLRIQYGMLVDQRGHKNQEVEPEVDEHPELTDVIIKRYEAKFLQRRRTNWNTLDKNKFIHTSRKLLEFAKDTNLLNELPVLLFRCLHKNYTEQGAPVHIGNCCSDHTWNVLMPQYLKEVGLPIAHAKV